MAETINQIERAIAAERDELGRNLNELQARARELTDWRRYYRNHPGQVLGVALASGVVLGIVAGGSGGTSGGSSDGPATPNRAMRRVEQDWHHITDALMGVASAKVMEFVGNLIPGVRDELHRHSSSSTSSL